ncbi:MAG: hypothetical protein GF401_11520 [Chitinivibrionales bacterium]|nr:hypothetical protein [Chitinivibrionales bacterium]
MPAFILFLFQTVIISMSGVMAPGPMTAMVIGRGNRSPHAGALISLGHGIVEIPLMILLLAGFGHVFSISWIKAATFLVGGIFLFVIAVDLFRSVKSVEIAPKERVSSPVGEGMLLSIGNPYFLVWWATVGMALIDQVRDFGITGFAVFALVHWLCDFVWFYFLSALSYRGGKFFGNVFQKVLFVVCGVALLFFGGMFVYRGVVNWV